MAGLFLKLAPNERVLINGAVIENGERRARISIRTPDANILRLRDAIHPEQVSTPVTRACYLAQMVLAGDMTADDGREKLLEAVESLSRAFRDGDSLAVIDRAGNEVLEGNFYAALRSLRQLIAREARLLGMGSS